MFVTLIRVLSGLFLAGILAAQTGPATIQAIGTATLTSTPDQAQITVDVTTEGTTAQDASQNNATRATAVINALKQLIGSTGTIQTVSYTVTPRYSTTPGQSSTIVGYTARNAVQVTTSNLNLPGQIIDTAIQAGATGVGSLSFGLQNPEPLKQQALTQAAKVALAHATAIASGLNARPGNVRSAVEGATSTPLVSDGRATLVTTPIQTGVVTVTATVTVAVTLLP